MQLTWMGEYRDLIEQLIRYANRYAQCYTLEQNFDTPVNFSYSQLQVLEYILENEERRENMAAIAARLGISPSSFSKHVNRMVQKGLLEKYHTGRNRKDVIIRGSPLGQQVYGQYAQFVYRNGFQAVFALLDEIPREYIDKFTHVLAVSCGDYAQLPPPPADPLIRIE